MPTHCQTSHLLIEHTSEAEWAHFGRAPSYPLCVTRKVEDFDDAAHHCAPFSYGEETPSLPDLPFPAVRACDKVPDVHRVTVRRLVANPS